MKLKEVILASLLIAFLVSQNYLLMYLPITLTYAVIYLITKAVKSKKVVFFSLIVYVLAKNIIYPAMPWTIIFDIIGLTLVTATFYTNNNLLKYLLTAITIIIHIFLLDFSTALIAGDVFLALPGIVLTSAPVYIYAPLSGMIIILLDGVEYITAIETE